MWKFTRTASTFTRSTTTGASELVALLLSIIEEDNVIEMEGYFGWFCGRKWIYDVLFDLLNLACFFFLNRIRFIGFGSK